MQRVFSRRTQRRGEITFLQNQTPVGVFHQQDLLGGDNIYFQNLLDSLLVENINNGEMQKLFSRRTRREIIFSKIWISFGLLRDFFWSAPQKPKEE